MEIIDTQVECRNQRKRVIDWHRCDLPGRQALEGLQPGAYLRLSRTTGEHFWAELVSKTGKGLVVRSADNLPGGQMRIGDKFLTSTGAVFNIV